jgi:hypothetical protein
MGYLFREKHLPELGWGAFVLEDTRLSLTWEEVICSDAEVASKTWWGSPQSVWRSSSPLSIEGKGSPTVDDSSSKGQQSTLLRFLCASGTLWIVSTLFSLGKVLPEASLDVAMSLSDWLDFLCLFNPCLLRWDFRLYWVVNDLLQEDGKKLHRYGFSPVWVRTWVFRWCEAVFTKKLLVNLVINYWKLTCYLRKTCHILVRCICTVFLLYVSSNVFLNLTRLWKTWDIHSGGS